MTTSPQHLPEDDDLDAAEYVLGVTDIAARQAFEARLAANPALAARVAAWEVHFSALSEDIVDMAPPADLMTRVEARLFPPSPAPDRAPGLFYRLWPVLGGALALVIAGWFAFMPTKPDMVAVLAPEGEGPSWSAALTGNELVLAQTIGEGAGDNNDYELWLIPADQPALALGVIPAGGGRFTIPDAPPGTILAVSLEPKGGAPGGVRSGPVLALGPLTSG